MIGRDLWSTPVRPRQSHHNESSNQSETGHDNTRQEQSLPPHPRHPRPVDNMSSQSFDPRPYSLDGLSEAPGGHQSSSVSRGRRVTRTRHDTHSRQSTSTRQRSSANESSQQPSPPQIPRTPVIRTLRQTSPRWQLSAPIPIPPRRPTDGNSHQHPPTPSLFENSWDEYVSDETITTYRAIGTQYQAWIAGPTTTECPIRRSSVTWTDLVHHPLEEYSFEVYLDEIRSTPEEAGNLESAGLSMGNDWRYVFLRRYGYWDDGRQAGYTVYQHRTGLGAIFVENITRRFGPYWAQVAQAQYQLDNHIDTLRYVYFINVQNLCTWPYVEQHLYPRHGLHWFDNYEPQFWTYGSREYQELLGTKLGRGVARLVLGAWPRGTHRIETIYTWTFMGNLQMRFDIKRI